MCRQLAVLVLAVIMAGCGGGGKSAKKGGNTSNPQPSGESFSLGGSVLGLQGNLVVRSGNDNLTINKDGNFSFPTKIAKGSLYDVDIVSLPENQLCELRNSKNYIYRNRNDLVVECANLVERSLKIDVPLGRSITEFRVLSNFQGLGGRGENPLTATESKIAVFDNSMLSLLDDKNQIIYLSYVGSVPAGVLELNSKTTAIALMLSSPTLISAIADRNKKLGDFIDVLLADTEINTNIMSLTSAIQNLVDAKGTLNTANDALTLSLAKTINSAVSSIAKISYGSTTPTASTAGDSLKNQKLTLTSSSDLTGINIAVNKLGTQNALQLSVVNQLPRYIKLISTAAPLTSVAAFGDATIELASGIGSQQSFDLVIIGPGTLGSYSAANIDSLIAASSATNLNQYFFPSLNVLLGLKDPAKFRTSDCLSDDVLLKLSEKSASKEFATSMLQGKDYYRLFAHMSLNLTDLFVSLKDAQQQSPVELLYSCEKFGSGVLISTRKAIAIENVSGILIALHEIFTPLITLEASNQGPLNHFSFTGLTKLFDAIKTSYAEKKWTLSNLLKLEVAAKKLPVVEGAPVELIARCLNPTNNQPIECEVNWNFGDNLTKTGLSVQNTYAKAGQYSVTATAKDADGAEHTQILAIEVLSFVPDIQLSLPTGIVQNGNVAYNYGDVGVGATASVSFTVTNRGFADLVLFNTSSSNTLYEVESNGINTLVPDASGKVNVLFKPLTVGSSESTISLLTNDPEQNNFTFKVIGKAVDSLGRWVFRQGNSQISFAATRITTVIDQENKTMQIRLFANATNDYPQVRLLLKNFDLNSNDRGDGTYNLDDINTDNSCLGFYGSAADEDNQFCTATLGLTDDTKATGEVIVSSTTVATNKRAAFSFNVYQRTCLNNPVDCPKAIISGEIQFNSN